MSLPLPTDFKALGLRYPIIQAPMAGGHTSVELVTAIAKAGGLGSIGAGYSQPDALHDQIRAIKAQTDKPLNVNVFANAMSENTDVKPNVQAALREIAEKQGIEAPDFAQRPKAVLNEQLDVIAAEDIAIVSFTFGCISADWIKRFKTQGTRIAGTATTVKESLYLQDQGCDMIVAQGAEAGGHRGSFLYPDTKPPMIGGLSLIPQIVDAVNVPVIASGGISDGRGVAAALCLGAQAVQLGTAFLVSEESGSPEAMKDAVQRAPDDSTVATRAFSGRYARGIENDFIRQLDAIEGDIPAYPVMNTLTGGIRKAASGAKNTQNMSLWAGQSASLCDGGKAADILYKIVKDTAVLLKP